MFTLPIAIPGHLAPEERPTACWADQSVNSRCYRPAVNDLGLCALHLWLYREESTPCP